MTHQKEDLSFQEVNHDKVCHDHQSDMAYHDWNDEFDALEFRRSDVHLGRVDQNKQEKTQGGDDARMTESKQQLCYDEVKAVGRTVGIHEQGDGPS